MVVRTPSYVDRILKRTNRSRARTSSDALVRNSKCDDDVRVAEENCFIGRFEVRSARAPRLQMLWARPRGYHRSGIVKGCETNDRGADDELHRWQPSCRRTGGLSHAPPL